MTPTGVLFSYAIGLIFAVGGVVFLVGLDDNRFLFGVPYLLLGLLILVGAYAGHRRLSRRAAAELAAAQEAAAAHEDAGSR